MAHIALHYTGLLPLAAMVTASAAGVAALARDTPRLARLAVPGLVLAAVAVSALFVQRGAAGPVYAGLAVALAAAAAGLGLYALRRGLPPERLLRWATLMVVAGWLLYWVPFVTLDFTLHEVFWNTSEGLPLWMRFAAAWSGGGGSLFLFSLFASLGGLYLLRGPAERRGLLVAGLAGVIVVGLAAAVLNDAFTLLERPPAGGAGLNPLLKSPWLYPHPLTTFGGYALLAVASVGLLAGGLARRSWIVYEIGWALLTVGIMLGGYWSYETFGWGGYWAWDPVETSELMVWLAATFLPHAAVSLGSLTGFAAGLTGSSVFLAMYVTRTGLSPLHSFAAPGLGALILLAAAAVLLAYAVVRLAFSAEAVSAELRRVFARPRPYPVSMLVAAVSLLGAALFVYATLFVPSFLVAAGREASVPQMSAGVQYFNPPLYAMLIVMLAAIPAAFLGDWLGWRGLAALLASVAAFSTAAGLAAARGIYSLAPLNPPETNAMMAAGLPWAMTAAAATIAYLWLSLRRRGRVALLRDRMVPMSLLHLGLALTVVGVLLSGAYAFNFGGTSTEKSYDWEMYLKPGEAVKLPGGHTIEFVGYRFGISNSTVDIYTNYVGRSPIYFYAQLALQSLNHTIAPYFRYYIEGSRMVEENKTLKTLFMYSSQSPYEVAGAEAETSVSVQLYTLTEQGFSNAPLYSGPASIEARNLSVEIPVTPNENTIDAWMGVVIYTDYLNVSYDGKGLTPKEHASVHDFVDVLFQEPLVVRVNDSLAVEIRHARLLPEILVRGGERGAEPINITPTGLAARNPLLLVLNGTLILEGRRYSVPMQLPKPVAGYLAAVSDSTILGLLTYVNGTSLYELLAEPKVLTELTFSKACLAVNNCLGYVAAPRTIPETAWLDIIIKVDNETLLAERIRFEAYGEIQGIHGLVSKVVHPSRGLDDIYVVLSPPTRPGDISGSPYHELMLYYLHEVFKRLRPEQRLALASLMAAGYNIDVLQRSSPDQAGLMLMGSVIDLYVAAERYNPDNPMVVTQGIHVKVRVIPGVRLVWLGPVLMSLSVVYAAAAALQAYRGGRGYR